MQYQNLMTSAARVLLRALPSLNLHAVCLYIIEIVICKLWDDISAGTGLHGKCIIWYIPPLHMHPLRVVEIS